jgi:hypothetical protein
MALLVKAIKFLKGIPTDINPNTDSLYAKSFVVGGATGTELTKAILDTLTAGAASDAGSLHMHDGRYFRKDQTISVSTGSSDAGLPIKTDSRGRIDPSFYQQSDLVHGNLSGLSADDHPQYHNDTRGDARYFRKIEFIATSSGLTDAGKPVKTNTLGKIDQSLLDSASVDHELLSNLLGGDANDHYHLTGAQHGTLIGGAASDASSLHNHDTRYYTKLEIDDALALKANDDIVIKKDGSVAFTENQSMGGNKLTGLADGTTSTDAINKGQLDASAALKVNKSGDTMTGSLHMGDNKVTGLADPENDTDAANKRYVDLAAQGLRNKEAVRAATTDDILLEGLQIVDGVELVDGDRVLVRAQTTPSQNGIYVASPGPWSRSLDADTSDKMKPGTTVFVSEGDTLKDLSYTLVTDAIIVLGSTDLLFTETSRLGQILAGMGLSKTGDTVHVNLGAGITNLPEDEVGLDLLPTGGLELVDPTTEETSTASDAQLAIKLDGPTLTRSADGLKVSELGVDTEQLADSSVTTAKIADENVTVEKLATDSVETIKIKDQNVTTEKLADQGVTAAKINPDVAGAGLTQDLTGALQVNADEDTIEVVDDTVQIKDQGVHRAKIEDQAVDSTKIDWGTTGTQVSAADLPIVNAASKFAGTSVEQALNELGEAAMVSTESAGEALGIGDLVCMRRDATGAAKLYKASADASDNYVGATVTLGDLTFTAVVPSGNDIRVRLVDPGVVNAALAVSLVGQDVTISLATDVTGSLTSTASDISTAVGASPTVSQVVDAAVSGTGINIQAAAEFTSLTGGFDFNDNGRWEVYGMAMDAAVAEGDSVRVKKIGRLACTFVAPPSVEHIGRTVYLSINKGKAVIGDAPTGSFSGIVSLGRLVSLTEVEFRAPILRGVNG